MAENSSTSNFDDYIAELHDNLDRAREIAGVDEQSSAIVADLAQAYSEHPSPMQTGDCSSSTANCALCSFAFEAMCLSALFGGQKNILTYLRRASSKAEVRERNAEVIVFE